MTFEPLTAERRRAQTREYLLEAAAQVFAERGFHGATLDDVAARAGFTKGAVYSNFKNKDDLFLALIEASFTREMAALHETLEGSEVPAVARLGDFADLVRGQLSEAPENWTSLYLEFLVYALRNPEAAERLRQIEAEDIRGVAAIIEDNRSAAAPPSASALNQSRLIFALFRGLWLLRALDPDAAGDELVADALAFVVRGLGEDGGAG